MTIKVGAKVQIFNDGSSLTVITRGERLVCDRRGEVVARLALTPWGKWKIVGEDTYAKTPEELAARLMKREHA